MVERLLTPEEVANKLAVSVKSVRNWLRQGKLKGIKVGRLWRIRESDLEEFLKMGESPPLRSYSKSQIEEFLKLDRLDPKLAEKLERLLGRCRLFFEADMELVEEASEADELMWEDLAPRKDLHVLAGAYKGRADVLVSLDRRHILTERVKSGFPIPVRSPGEFLREIAEGIEGEEGEGCDRGAC